MTDTNYIRVKNNTFTLERTMDDLLDQSMEDHISCGYGDILDDLAAEEFADEYPDHEPWDECLAQQELEDFEQADEYFGHYGEDW